MYGGTMLPGCGKIHKNLSAGSPFEVIPTDFFNFLLFLA